MKNIHEILEEMTEIYSKKMPPDLNLVVQLEEVSENESWFISIKPGQSANLTKTCSENPQIIFSFSKETLIAIYSGKMTGLTAVGRENISDKTPLNIKLGAEIKMTKAIMDKMYIFIQQFFNPTIPETITLDKSQARKVHGAYAIPMFYHSGFRSAWYQLDIGDKLNNEGDTNPFPQAFIIIKGQGYAKIGDIV